MRFRQRLVCGHLLVHIVVPDGYSVVDAMSTLRRDVSRLRSEVAMAIARKRAPELSFVPVSGARGRRSVIRRWLRFGVGWLPRFIETCRTRFSISGAPRMFNEFAVMPDVHLPSEVCIGVVIATSHLIYPQAVGGDIGCGMLAVAIDAEASSAKGSEDCRNVAERDRPCGPLAQAQSKRCRSSTWKDSKHSARHAHLEAIRQREGAIEFATLGSGNHFLEMQADEEDRLWLMVHSGSRALGQVIRDHHLARAQPVEGRLRALDAESEAGKEYVHDVLWARQYAAASRKAMAEETGKALTRTLKCSVRWETIIAIDHNHVALERHGEREFWVHRKGAMSAQQGQPGVLPGSMGSPSFHVEGRGCEEALCSSAHGAGRALSRGAARNNLSERELRRQMEGGLVRLPADG